MRKWRRAFSLLFCQVETLTAPPRPPISVRALLAASAAPAVTLLVLLPTLAYPFGRDQAVFAYVGEVIARGGMPYRDAWDLKPPGIYLAYSLLAALSRDGAALMTAVRLADLAIAALTALLLARLIRRFTKEGADLVPAWALGAGTAGWYAALYLHGTYWSLAQAEAWANPLLLAAILLLLGRNAESRPKPSLLLAAGGLLGGVALLKFTSVLPALPFAAWVAWSAWRETRDFRQALIPLVLIAAGGTVVLGLAAAWLAVGGALVPYLDIQRGFVAPYARLGAPGLGEGLAALFGHTLGWAWRAALPIALAGIGLAADRWWQAEERRLAAASLFAGLLAVWWQGKYFGYHWQTVLPWLALTAAIGTAALAERLRLPRPLALALLPTLAFAWSIAVHWSDYRDAARYAVGSLPREEWLERFGPPGRGDYSYLATERAAAYLRKQTQSGDPVLVWGFEPSIYLLADRRSPTRFFFNVPVAVRFAPESWKREFLAAFDTRPPRMLVVLRNDAIPWATARTDDSAAQLADWPELAERVRRDYRELGRKEDFLFYQRHPHNATPRGESQNPDARTP